ncbi:RNA polymerase subunit sigma-24 [Flavobacterium akiainvivens]|uniref:RNA polymerase subunit sigma-24 n=1 Tax=Flavobacterium akiainvivens TaxID=1202724 RepID=A0A0M8MCB8_9FLAO|nr:sigma-70 family RNA polymerase sigma factor [Flavobacterium akiainvivens]KOS08233.1 RNA polymerase subunit sigma-24 [Flavobacterium akiainvivens]
MENSKLVKKLRQGDQKAYKEVYMAYFDRLVQVAKKFDFKFLTPQDLVQETFLHLYKQRDLLKEDVLFDKQLFVICKNLIINHLNRENKVIPLDPHKFSLPEEETTQPDFETQRNRLNHLLEQLPEQQRKIFTLHKLDNYSYREIAEITNLSEKTIANHIYLATKFIKNS